MNNLHLNNVHLTNTSIIAIIMILAGFAMVIFDLSRIYRYWIHRRWTSAIGTVANTTSIGGLAIAVTFTYIGYEGYTRQYRSSQTLARDSWAEGLKTGSHVPVRYNPKNPTAGLIDYQQVWKHSLIGSLNSLWIILGLALLLLQH